MRPGRPILVVEDEFLDVQNIERAFKKTNAERPLRYAPDGRSALEDLERSADATEPRDRPGLILLDLNLPVMNGVEFLRKVKGDERFRKIPVVVLTSSNTEEDRARCYDLSVAGYFVKPIRFEELTEILRRVEDYWTTSELP